MGEANRRKEISARRLGILQPWLQRFVAAVKTLALTEETSRELLVEAGLFNTFICIITDVEVILLSQYHKESGRSSCSILPETYRSTKEAIESGPIWLFRNREGYLGCSTSPPFDFEGGLNSISGISGPQIRLADGEEWIYTSIRLIGWNKLEQLDPEAYVVSELLTHRLIKNIKESDFVCNRREKPTTLLRVLNENYKLLLDRVEREEELQSFLRRNPIILYPEYINVHPKFKLGREYVTDFVFLNSGYTGKEYVFVEIERPSKSMFTRADVFSSDLTQALDQIINSESWIKHNHAYLRNDFPELREPVFHLVYGRSSELSSERERKIRSHFARLGIRFSTFDDLANKLTTVLDRIEELSQRESDAQPGM